MSKPVFDLYQLNQELISANTRIVHLYSDIAELRQALALSQARLKNRDLRIGQLKYVLGEMVESAEEAVNDTYLEGEE